LSITWRTVIWGLVTATCYICITRLLLHFYPGGMSIHAFATTKGAVIWGWNILGPIIAGNLCQAWVRHPRPVVLGIIVGCCIVAVSYIDTQIIIFTVIHSEAGARGTLEPGHFNFPLFVWWVSKCLALTVFGSAVLKPRRRPEPAPLPAEAPDQTAV
jgi:hypothetical protein